MIHIPPFSIGEEVGLGFGCSVGDGAGVDDAIDLKGMVGTEIDEELFFPSLSPSSSSSDSGALVQAAPSPVLVRVVVVVPTTPQPVMVALNNSVQDDEAVEEAEIKSVQELKTSVTVVLSFSSQLFGRSVGHSGGSPVFGPQ